MANVDNPPPGGIQKLERKGALKTPPPQEREREGEREGGADFYGVEAKV
jgi:hypothetical protein